MLELGAPGLLRLLLFEQGREGACRVHGDPSGRGLQRHRHAATALAQPQPRRLVAVDGTDRHVDGPVEDGSVVGARDGDGQLPVSVAPAGLEAGGSATGDPLVEDPGQVLAAHILQRPTQVLGLHEPPLVRGHVLPDAGVEDVAAEQVLQVAQHRGAAAIDVGVVPVALLAPGAGRHGGLSARRPVAAVEHARRHLVATLAGLCPAVGVVGGEALVEPQLAPAVAGEQVAEPLVGELVGAHGPSSTRAAVHPRLASARIRLVDHQDGCRGVLHPPVHVPC